MACAFFKNDVLLPFTNVLSAVFYSVHMILSGANESKRFFKGTTEFSRTVAKIKRKKKNRNIFSLENKNYTNVNLRNSTHDSTTTLSNWGINTPPLFIFPLGGLPAQVKRELHTGRSDDSSKREREREVLFFPLLLFFIFPCLKDDSTNDLPIKNYFLFLKNEMWCDIGALRLLWLITYSEGSVARSTVNIEFLLFCNNCCLLIKEINEIM